MRCLGLAVLVLTLWLGRDAQGSGFAIFEHGARGIGSAFAGEAAGAEDAATVFWNPAGLTLLDGTQVVSAMDVILTSARFADRGSTLSPAVGGGPLTGGDGPNAGATGVVPSFYLAHEVTPRLHLGLGVDAPFGLKTQYDRLWVGRYQADVSDLKTINGNPSFAVRLTDWLSLGAGMSVQYAQVKLSNAIDLGSACSIFGAAAGLTPATCAALGLKPQGADGFVKIKGSDWGFGYNGGLMFHPTPRLHLGLAYRSRVEHDLGGPADFSVPKKAKILTATGALKDTSARAQTSFPDSAVLAAFYQLTARWAILSDITWTHWDLLNTLSIRFTNPAQPTVVLPEHWQDSFRYAVGTRFDPVPAWSFRGGFAYDETAVRSPRYRDPRIPDSDRYWLTIGGGYHLTPRTRIDVGYAHIFIDSTTTRNVDPVTGDRLVGHYNSSANVFGAQVNIAFR